jgi:glycosyltransferase involved in cell wall biosynthesis
VRIDWLSPGDPAQRTGGYLWNARIAEGLRALGHDVRFVAVEGRWPAPGLADPAPLVGIPDGGRVVADGLLWPGLGAAGAALAGRCRVAVVVHSLLAQETGVADRDRLDGWERAALGLAALRVATSALTAEALGPALPSVTVIPGTAPAAPCAGGDGQTLLTVGTLTRRKGHDRLLDALVGVTAGWRLLCAGAPRDPAWAEALRERVQAAGLAERVVWLGDLDEAGLEAAYARADVVVQAARYEAFGMAITEAVARGLPVVTTPAGAVRHLPTGAVREVDERGLGEAIEALLGDAAARRAQAARAGDAALALPTWAAQAERLAAQLEGLT